APAGWSGDAAEAAGHARTRFARRVDVAQSALQRAAVATTVFEDRMVVLRSRRKPLSFERDFLNGEIRRARLDLHNGDLTGAAAVEVAAMLRSRAARLTAAIADWLSDVADAETTYVAALRRIDTVAEARREEQRSQLPRTGTLVRHLQAIGRDPAAVAAWWLTLSLAQRQAVMVASPMLVGRTDGIPITGRDRANRVWIAERRSHLQQRAAAGTITAQERHTLANLDALQHVLDDHRHDVDPVSGRGLLNVIEYSPTAYGGDGTSIISLGNPDHVRHVATYTPGFSSDGGTLSGFGQIEDLRHAMHQRSGSVATVLYENYDAPSADEIHGLGDVLDPARRHPALTDALGVTNTTDAEAGGHRLADFLDGLDATRHHRGADVTVIGHSYGSVMAAYAAQDASPHGRTDLDSLVLLADPGAPGSNVHDLVADSSIRVYVGADDHDPVSLIGSGPHGGPGTLGVDPATTAYGAQRIGEWTGPESIDGVIKFGNHRAGNYLGSGTDGLDNVAALATGGSPHLVPGRDAGNYESIDDLAAHALLNATPSASDNLVYDYGGRQLLHGLARIPGPVRDAMVPVPVAVGRAALFAALKGLLS
ncbi:MAG TPA: alpha/beta hydrolase, partial [Nocardioides sp.]|nr:alpha/beta hydrolase [Nocardioides sp.]